VLNAALGMYAAVRLLMSAVNAIGLEEAYNFIALTF